MSYFVSFCVCLAVQEGGLAGHSYPLSDGHSSAPDQSNVAPAAASELDPEGRVPRLLGGGEGGGVGDAGEAAAADAAVHGAAAPWVAMPLQPHREVAHEQ